MEHSNIASIEVENMILYDADNSVSTEFNMPDVETMMEELSQPMDMEEEDSIHDAVLVPLRTLMDVDATIVPQQVPTAAPTVVVECSAEKVRTRKPRGPYRRYTAHQIEQLFDLVIEEGQTAKEAALITDINIRTDQNYVKKYNDDEERRLPLSIKKAGAGTQSLCDAFPGLSISISALHRHLVQKCKVTLKRLQKLPAARNSDRVIKLRKEIIEQWEAMPDLDFAKNCVFIDEAGFNLHTQRNYGRSLKGTPAKSTVPTARGVTIPILGAYLRQESYWFSKMFALIQIEIASSE